MPSKAVAQPIKLGLLLLFAGVTSCGVVNVPPVDQISLVSVDVVEPDQIRDPGDALNYTLHTDDPAPMVRVTFSSPDDFQKIAMDWQYFSIGDTIGFCKGSSIDFDMQLDGLPDLYDSDAMIDVHRPASFGSSRKYSTGPILYHIYFDPRRSLPRPTLQADRAHQRSYDLTKHPQDVCFHIKGGQEDIPVGFHTNTLRIPSDVLVSAFRRAHLSCLPVGRHCKRSSPAPVLGPSEKSKRAPSHTGALQENKSVLPS